MELETAFYIIAIVYMGLMFILCIALLVVALIIKSKINKIQRMVDYRVDQVKSVGDKAIIVLDTLRYFIKS